MKGLTCHIAFDLLSLEQDKREAKCQVIRVTHPHMHTQTETERDECFIIKPQTHQAFSRYKQKAYHSGGDNSHQWHLQCVSATGFSCPFLQVCLFLLLGPCKPSDLLAERGLCPAGGGEDVTDAGASEPASCSVNFPRLICIHKEPTPCHGVFSFLACLQKSSATPGGSTQGKSDCQKTTRRMNPCVRQAWLQR